MNLRLTTIAAIVAAAVTAPTAGAHILRPGCNSHLRARAELRCATVNLDHARFTIQWARDRLSYINRLRAVQERIRSEQALVSFPLTYSGSVVRLHNMIRDHRWVATTFRQRIAEAHRRLVPPPPPTPTSWWSAVQYVQRWYPGSAGWLMSCSSSEGGWGGWVPNTQGSGAGGWMQYMEGTFWSDYSSATRDLRSRGISVPSSSASWYNALGQAIAAGWAYGHARPPGKWTGARC